MTASISSFIPANATRNVPSDYCSHNHKMRKYNYLICSFLLFIYYYYFTSVNPDNMFIYLKLHTDSQVVQGFLVVQRDKFLPVSFLQPL